MMKNPIFQKKIIIYSGWNLIEVNKIRECLEKNKIKFYVSMKDTTNRFVGRGTTRSNFGSAGINSDYQIFYTIKVNQKDEYAAKSFLSKMKLY